MGETVWMPFFKKNLWSKDRVSLSSQWKLNTWISWTSMSESFKDFHIGFFEILYSLDTFSTFFWLLSTPCKPIQVCRISSISSSLLFWWWNLEKVEYGRLSALHKCMRVGDPSTSSSPHAGHNFLEWIFATEEQSGELLTESHFRLLHCLFLFKIAS